MYFESLKPSLKKQVLKSLPNTIDQVISNALFLEKTASGVTPEKIKGWEQHRNKDKSDPTDRVTRSMERLTLCIKQQLQQT